MARSPLTDRLKDALWRPVSEERRTADLAAITAAVENTTLEPSAVPTMRRRFTVVAVAAGLSILPAGIAIAAESSVPGEVLYPVKKVTETVRSWVDEDIVAQHRIEELERLVAADAPDEIIADQIERARNEVDRLGPDHDLAPRLSGATAGLADDRIGPGPGAGPGPSSTTTVVTSDTTPPTTVPPDRPGTTTTTVAGPSTTVPPVDSTTTTTTVRTDVETFRLRGYVHAGPTCPVEKSPPDPDCADQPVAGAVLVITDEAGTELERVESNRAGQFQTRLPNGVYLLVPQPYDGLLGTAEVQEFVVDGRPVELDVAYDTGIR